MLALVRASLAAREPKNDGLGCGSAEGSGANSSVVSWGDSLAVVTDSGACLTVVLASVVSYDSTAISLP